MLGRSKTGFVDNVILYIENPKGSKKLFELINQFSRTSAYTINTDNRFYFYILAMNKSKNCKSNSIYNSFKKNKILVNNVK